MSSTFRSITVYGAGGDNMGKFILEAFVNNGYNVSVLSRKSLKSEYPRAVRDVRVSDDLPQTELVEALKDQDAVVSAVGFGNGALETQYEVIDAAVEPGVKRFLPSAYGFDNADPKSAWLSPVLKIRVWLRITWRRKRRSIDHSLGMLSRLESGSNA